MTTAWILQNILEGISVSGMEFSCLRPPGATQNVFENVAFGAEEQHEEV